MKIESAAIKYKEVVYVGSNHAEIGHRMIRDGVCNKPFPGGDNQGFVTDAGDYVCRDIAMKIALRAGQVKAGETSHRYHLFSEDIGGKPPGDSANG